jgi:hypothetical protein
MAEWASGNIFIRSSGYLDVGKTVEGHTHTFDHTTVVFTGAVHVVKARPLLSVDGTPKLDGNGSPLLVVVEERDFEAPSHFLVEANAYHRITALKDGTQYWCVYSHREPQGDIVQHVTGWMDAYV